jgi:hypothetical protein
VIGDVQFLPGYSVLLTDDPAVQRLSDLPPRAGACGRPHPEPGEAVREAGQWAMSS